MLIGDYRCSVDAKGRVSFPAKLRADLGARFIITRSLSDHCISVYSLEEWQSIIDRLHAMPQNKSRNIRRMLSGFASEAEPDAQGRIVLPLSLRQRELGSSLQRAGFRHNCSRNGRAELLKGQMIWNLYIIL